MDYIRNLEKLDVPLTNKMLLPENFVEAHDISVKKVKLVSSKTINKKYNKDIRNCQKTYIAIILSL